MKKLLSSIRLNRQYLRVPLKPEVDLDFRYHKNMVARETAQNGFLDLEYVENEEIIC